MWEDGGVGLDMLVLGSGDLAAGGLAIVGVDGCQKKEEIASFSLPFWQFGAELRAHLDLPAQALWDGKSLDELPAGQAMGDFQGVAVA